MSHGSMNGYVLATVAKQTARRRAPRMHHIDKGPTPNEDERKVSEKYRKEFLEAARQYLFGMLSAKSAATSM